MTLPPPIEEFIPIPWKNVTVMVQRELLNEAIAFIEKLSPADRFELKEDLDNDLDERMPRDQASLDAHTEEEKEDIISDLVLWHVLTQ